MPCLSTSGRASHFAVRNARPLEQDGKRTRLERRMSGKVDAHDPPAILSKFINAPHQEIEPIILALEGDHLNSVFHETVSPHHHSARHRDLRAEAPMSLF